MKIVIPMAGKGKRFLSAGYETPKTLIPIEGRPVVEHVVKHFSPNDEFIFGINSEHDQKTDMRKILQSLVPSGKIISMEYEKGGPIATVNRMSHEIHDDEPVIVNYCDFSWVWDYEHFKKTVAANDCDGAVVCYRGFHPHLLGPNHYATLDADGLWMKEIREKHSWHDNKQKDWTSSGTYYFKKGSYIKKYFREIEQRPDWKINGEHYVSQIYQLMKEDGLKIFIYEIPYMLQWGTPEDMEEYLYWSHYFKRKNQIQPERSVSDGQTLILMAGAGQRFADAGYTFPKPYIPVDGGVMVERSAKSLPQNRAVIFMTRDELRHPKFEERLTREFQSPKIVSLLQLTEGQASTALCAKPELDPEKPLLIGACDHQIFYNDALFQEWTQKNSGVDAIIFTYRNNPNVKRNPNAYGWVDVDSDGRVKSVSVKKPLPGDPVKNHAIIGSFWFRKARYFFENAEQMVRENSRINHEFYIDQAMNFLIRSGLSVKAFEVDAYASWGTPDDLKTYEYWQKFHLITGKSDIRSLKKMSVVIPAYNEAQNLAGLIERIDSCVDKNKIENDVEWILVDNGSRDETWSLLQEYAVKRKYLRPVQVKVNTGYGNGILAGLRVSQAPVLAWTHADCQTDPEDALKAFQAYEKEAKTSSKVLIKGKRQDRPWLDGFLSLGMQVWASLMLGVKLSEVNAQPKLFPRELYSAMTHPPADFSLDLYLMYAARKNNYPIVEIPVYFKPRLHGEAKGGGGSFSNRLKLIRRTFKYISELRRKFQVEGI